jgi:hypothetical protein
LKAGPLTQAGFGALVPGVAPAVDVVAAIKANYRIYAYLETQTLMGLEGGMYKFI